MARDESGWSLASQRYRNAVAAIKAVLRHQDDVATGLLERGYPRIDHDFDPAKDTGVSILELANMCAGLEPALQDIATEVRHLVDTLSPK